MTAEQTLIEENKKDQRVRYITEDAKSINLWSIKPFFDYEFSVWVGIKVTLISSLKYQVFSDFKGKDSIDCILCIDDITPEAPPIPEKWYIECTKENRDILNRWRLIKARYYTLDCYFSSGSILFSDDSISKDGSYYYFGGLPKNNQKIDDYQEITLEQFKKFVLKSEEKQEEIQEPNDFKLSSSHYVAGRIGSVDLSGKYFKTGRIGSVDMNSDPFANTNNDSTFEFYSTKCWLEDRINYINQFIKKTIDSNLCINPEWISERNELIEKLKNL